MQFSRPFTNWQCGWLRRRRSDSPIELRLQWRRRRRIGISSHLARLETFYETAVYRFPGVPLMQMVSLVAYDVALLQSVYLESQADGRHRIALSQTWRPIWLVLP